MFLPRLGSTSSLSTIRGENAPKQISRFDPMNFHTGITLSLIGGEGQGEGATRDLPKMIAACKLLNINASFLRFMGRVRVTGNADSK